MPENLTYFCNRNADYKVWHNFWNVLVINDIFLAFLWPDQGTICSCSHVQIYEVIAPFAWGLKDRNSNYFIYVLMNVSLIPHDLQHGQNWIPNRKVDHRYRDSETRVVNKTYGIVYIMFSITEDPCHGKITYIIKVQPLTHWGRATHICVDKLTTIGSDNGLNGAKPLSEPMVEYC